MPPYCVFWFFFRPVWVLIVKVMIRKEPFYIFYWRSQLIRRLNRNANAALMFLQHFSINREAKDFLHDPALTWSQWKNTANVVILSLRNIFIRHLLKAPQWKYLRKDTYCVRIWYECDLLHTVRDIRIEWSRFSWWPLDHWFSTLFRGYANFLDTVVYWSNIQNHNWAYLQLNHSHDICNITSFNISHLTAISPN